MKPFNGKKLPIDLAAFEIMREENYLYVDKTQHISRMLDEGRYYFLSRPRRFGKSLLVSTLKCLFHGRKELFEGLWIATQSNWKWEKHPVILLDFNDIPGSHPDELKQGLTFCLHEIADTFRIALKAPLIELQFRELILALAQKFEMPTVVLVDEYDKRIIDHLGKGRERMEIAKANRDILKSFFGILKSGTIVPELRFVLLTGISRFSKVSIFSELNNLIDVSMDQNYAALLGYTQQELTSYFHEYIEQFATTFAWPSEQVIAQLARYYDGYRFSRRDLRVYNPFSILRAFHYQELRDFWFESATPSFLIQLLKEKQYEFPEIEHSQMLQTMTTYDLDHLEPEVLLFQTGYVTIKDIQNDVYILDYPNQEVKQAFIQHILFSHTQGIPQKVRSHVMQLSDYLKEENFEAFFETMRAIFASIPYDIESQRDEAYFHTIFYLMMSASGLAVQSSVLTCQGRIDLVIEFPEKVYIIEFKCNQNAQTAIQQILDKQYADKYRACGKKIVLLGINFNTEQRNLSEWEIVDAERLPQQGSQSP